MKTVFDDMSVTEKFIIEMALYAYLKELDREIDDPRHTSNYKQQCNLRKQGTNKLLVALVESKKS